MLPSLIGLFVKSAPVLIPLAAQASSFLLNVVPDSVKESSLSFVSQTVNTALNTCGQVASEVLNGVGNIASAAIKTTSHAVVKCITDPVGAALGVAKGFKRLYLGLKSLFSRKRKSNDDNPPPPPSGGACPMLPGQRLNVENSLQQQFLPQKELDLCKTVPVIRRNQDEIHLNSGVKRNTI